MVFLSPVHGVCIAGSGRECGTRYAVCGARYAVCGTRCAVRGTRQAVRERGTRTEYEIPGRMEDGGWKRPMVSFFFFLSFFSREMSNGARATRDPPVTHPRMIKIPGRAAAPPDPPGLRLRAKTSMADALKIYSRDLCICIYAYAYMHMPLSLQLNPPRQLDQKSGSKTVFRKNLGIQKPNRPLAEANHTRASRRIRSGV